MKIPVKLTDDKAKLPTRGTPQSNGYDLYTPINIDISPGETVDVNLKIALEIPDGYVGLICPRSGLAKKLRLTILNSPSVIDSDYRGEITCMLHSQNHQPHTLIEAGDRIAQILIIKTEEATFEQVNELTATQRGANGLGSTGR